MKKVIAFHGKTISYELRVSQKARKLRLTVKKTGEVFLTMPSGMKFSVAQRFIAKKSPWVEKSLQYFKSFEGKFLLDQNKKNFLAYKNVAKVLAEERVAHFNKIYGFSVGKITIRNQKSRWGSCSRDGNLSFNYKIALLPAQLADYIIVHELSHLGQLNHSDKFWNLIAKTLPNYQELKSNFA